MDIDVFRRRLEWLIAFRVAVVTFAFGGLLALDIQKLSSLSEPGNAVILGLIVGTYMLTIVYSVALRAGWNLDRLATIQVFIDFAIITVVVLLTGASQSVFSVLLFIAIIITAFIRGQTAAFGAAAYCSLLFGVIFLAEHQLIAPPLLDELTASKSVSESLFTVGINSGGAFLIAFLSGYLTEQLGGLESRLHREQLNVRQLERLNKDILASLNSGLITVDRQRRLIFYNTAAERIVGAPLYSNLGEPLEESFPTLSEILNEVESRGELKKGDQTPSRIERSFENESGDNLHIGVSVSVLSSARYTPSIRETEYDNGRILVLQDLTELSELREQKKRSERLAAIGRLAGSMAHEIRNPLASMKGSLELLESEMDTGQKSQEAELMDVVQRDVERLNNLVNEFLEYGRLRRLERDKINIRELLKSVLKLFENRDHGADVIFAVTEPLISDDYSVWIDREAIEQVIWNLLNNAVDAMEDQECGRERLLVELNESGSNRILIGIEDSGPGVPEDKREEVFDPFFTTKDSGTGLGLATSHRIIAEHDGELRLKEGRKLKGARFEISLPKTRE